MPEWRHWHTSAEPEAVLEDGKCKNAVYMGFELETDGYDRSYDNSRAAARAVSESGVCLCKGDGSLSSYGVEYVSHPRTLLSHKAFDWPGRFQTILSKGGRSYDCSSSCGLHIHVNRECLSPARWRALDQFVNANEVQCMRFAQRRHSNWARFDSQLNQSTREEAKAGHYRYVAINFCNYSTIEFRFFKGTLHYPRFLASLEFVDGLVWWIKRWPAKDTGGTWEDFCRYLAQNEERYAECIAYMKHRELWPIG